jgi:Uma2 family endonuclease
MAQVISPSLTVQDYFDLPEGSPRCQLIEGDFHMMPPPNRFHQSVQINIAAMIKLHLNKHPIGKVYCAPIGVILSEMNAFEPDVVFVSKKRAKILSERGIEGAPDFVVEILSPGTTRYDKGPKRAIYARSGVTELWLVEPVKREIDVFYLQDDPERPVATYAERDKLSSPLLPGLAFDCRQIFAD